MCTEPRYLLIVACSQRKRVTPEVLPALERYDGMYFRVLRKARRESYWPEKLDVLIVSAKYGLVAGDTPVAHYDVCMTREQATYLRPLVVAMLAERIASRTYTEIFLNHRCPLKRRSPGIGLRWGLTLGLPHALLALPRSIESTRQAGTGRRERP